MSIYIVRGYYSNISEPNLPKAKPSFVHCTCPAKFETSHRKSASEPSSTCKSCGVVRNFCCCALEGCIDVRTGIKKNIF